MMHKIITLLPESGQKKLIDVLEYVNIHRVSCERIMMSSINEFIPRQSCVVDRNGKPGKEFLVTFIEEKEKMEKQN